MSAPYTMQALQELADDGVHLLEIDDAGLVATVQELDALRARVAELERVQDAAFRDAHRAEADAARLREALTQVRDAMLATGQGPDGDDDPRRPVAAAVWRALASVPSASVPLMASAGVAVDVRDLRTGDITFVAEPTPRDMRVACHAWNHGFTKGREYEALDTLEAMQRVGEFTLGEGIDLAAVVAKAVGT